MNVIAERLQSFFESRLHLIVLTLAGIVTTLFSLEHYAIPLFVLWIIFIIALDKNFTDILYPILLLNAIALRTAGETTYLLNHAWLAVPAVIAITMHFVLYGKRPVLGKSFPALVAVSAALLLGGVGVISAKDYFNFGASLYYILMLGIGMIMFYLWMRGDMYSTPSYRLSERILEILYFLGAFCAFSMIEQGARMLVGFGGLVSFTWSNDICEMMLFALAVPFFFARRRFVHFFVPFAFYLSMIPTRSFSALAVGAVILTLGLVYSFAFIPEKRIFIGVFSALAASLAILLLYRFDMLSTDAFLAFFAAEENGRGALLKKAWENFLRSPLFGVGMGYGGGIDGFMGTAWTHNLPMQILGSMGIVGVLAYGYQLVVRAKLVFAKRDAFHMMMGISYLGIFLISMLQPGEFCPMPYEFLAVAIFCVLELYEKREAPYLTLDKTE